MKMREIEDKELYNSEYDNIPWIIELREADKKATSMIENLRIKSNALYVGTIISAEQKNSYHFYRMNNIQEYKYNSQKTLEFDKQIKETIWERKRRQYKKRNKKEKQIETL